MQQLQSLGHAEARLAIDAVSGLTSEEDVELAALGIAAMGLPA